MNDAAVKYGSDEDQRRKRFETLRAQLAGSGFALHELSCGGYLIARWDRTAHAPDLHAVQCFLERVKGAA